MGAAHHVARALGSGPVLTLDMGGTSTDVAWIDPGQELPLTTLHETVLKSCLAHGEGDLDNAAVINEVRRRTRKAGAA